MPGSSARYRLEIGQFSHPGQKRTNNEDWLGTFQPEDEQRLARKGSLFLVADGMGGHRSGETASRAAVSSVIRAYMDAPGADVEANLRSAIEFANSALYQLGAGAVKTQRQGTTLVAAVVRHDQLWIANVGDSRAYLLHDGALRQLSRDHSLAAALADGGQTSDGVGRHVITRALGARPGVEVDLFGPLRLVTGDCILLCTDGLTGPVCDADIEHIARSGPPQQVAESLIAAANEHGGPDNVSAIVIHITQAAGKIAGAPFRRVLGGLRAEIESLLFRRGPRRPSRALIAAAVLLVLALLGLGFALGLYLFTP